MTVLADLSRDLSRIAEAAAASVVAIEGPRSALSGFVWRDRLVVAAEEGLDDDEGLVLHLPGGGRVEASLVGRDASTDVALLRAEGLPEPAALADAPRAAGEMMVAVGRSAEAGALVAVGTLGHAGPAWRSLRGGRIDARLGLDLRLPSRAQGGLAVAADGSAIGMAVTGPRRTALAIPAATIDRVAEHLLAHGRIARGYLGVSLHPVRLEGGGAGVMVVGLEEAGPARAAGVIQGDVIQRLDGEAVESGRHLARKLGPETVGTTVTLDILRGGEARSLTVTVGERPT